MLYCSSILNQSPRVRERRGIMADQIAPIYAWVRTYGGTERSLLAVEVGRLRTWSPLHPQCHACTEYQTMTKYRLLDKQDIMHTSFISNNLRHPSVKLEPYAPSTACRQEGWCRNATGISPKISLATEQPNLMLFSLPTSSSTSCTSQQTSSNIEQIQSIVQLESIKCIVCLWTATALTYVCIPFFYFPNPDELRSDFSQSVTALFAPQRSTNSHSSQVSPPEKKPYPFTTSFPAPLRSLHNHIHSPTLALERHCTYNHFKHFFIYIL